jgi:hypothetical protein
MDYFTLCGLTFVMIDRSRHEVRERRTTDPHGITKDESMEAE